MLFFSNTVTLLHGPAVVANKKAVTRRCRMFFSAAPVKYHIDQMLQICCRKEIFVKRIPKIILNNILCDISDLFCPLLPAAAFTGKACACGQRLLMTYKRRGIKMIRPVAAAMMAAIRTAPAAVSFARFASG